MWELKCLNNNVTEFFVKLDNSLLKKKTKFWGMTLVSKII